MDNEKALIGLAAAALGVGFVVGRRNKRTASMKNWNRAMEVAALQRELKLFVTTAPITPDMTAKQYEDGINTRIDFMKIVEQM